jgi:4-hydroxythreonine-4-phosphate dehydrogenase
MIVVSTGCPASIGPEISLRAAMALRAGPRVLVGDEATLLEAAKRVGVSVKKLRRLTENKPRGGGVYIYPSGPTLTRADRRPGEPTPQAGRAQLQYIEDAYALAKRNGAALVTAAVSKAAIAGCGLKRARRFRGHTEWLRELDGADPVTMCFYSPKISTSLVTTHLPLRKVAAAIDAEGVRRATRHLARLLHRAGHERPTLAVCSLNPHAGEDELLGDDEAKYIVPGATAARKKLYGKAKVVGPIGAETAFRRAAAGEYDGVVAMYHDQATIPMKLLAFGEAVNVTMGLSLVRTSVDHGTAYDIAWKGEADPAGMLSAMKLAEHLNRSRRAGREAVA